MNINKKGYIYTLSAVILILILIFFILFISRFTETEIEDVTGKIRCDELHFFVEDVKVDLERGLMITGRRATIYAISNQIMGSSKISSSYKFNCTPSCSYCSDFNYSGVGAEAAIAELMFCGTLYGVENPYMTNHTVKKWIDKLKEHANKTGFVVEITPTNFKISPYGAWNFTSSLEFRVNINDTTDMCFFSLYDATIDFITPINDIEDPLYTMNTGYKAIKITSDCEIIMHAKELSKGTIGWGWAVGNAVIINNISDTGKLSSANESKIVVISYLNMFNGSYDSDLINYGGIITNWSINLDNLSIRYLASASTSEIEEDMSIILLASKYYPIDIDLNGTSHTCINHNIWWVNETSSSVEQKEWFTDLVQASPYKNRDVTFLFANDSECKIAPQIEVNSTWTYTLEHPTKSAYLHFIASSTDTVNYNVTIKYDDNLTQNFSVELVDHCYATIPPVQCNCTNCNGEGYDSQCVSLAPNTSQADSGHAFEDTFENIDYSEGDGCGQTVQHITMPLNDNKKLSQISITDPYNKSVIWAVTIEMAPMSVWNLSKGSGDFANPALFMCYNTSTTGPSFFDRIENNKNITEKYQNQTNNIIGLESFLSIRWLASYGVDVFSDRTAMEYLYFSEDKTGYPLIGTNESGIYYFRIDLDNAINYNVYDLINWEDTAAPSPPPGGCLNACESCTEHSNCCSPLVCFEGACDGCVDEGTIESCKKDALGNTYDVYYTVYTKDAAGDLVDVDSITINVEWTNGGKSVSGSMVRASKGTYTWDTDSGTNWALRSDDKLKATATIEKAGCADIIIYGAEEEIGSDIGTCP